MGIHLHIDNRLIHGQVTITWCAYYGVEKIMVIDDKAANDPIQRIMLPQAARSLKTIVNTVVEGIKNLKKFDLEKEETLIITANPHSALLLINAGLKPKTINVGNQAPISGTKSTMVLPWITVTDADAKDYEEIGKHGVKITPQRTPDDKSEDLVELLKKKKLL